MITGAALTRGTSLFLLLLASCGEPSSPKQSASPTQAPPASESAVPSSEETAEITPCGSENLARFVGAMATPAVRKAIESAAGQAPVRWIAPGQAITLDFNPARLNVMLDERNTIATMRCG
jgi:hypothetical protein